MSLAPTHLGPWASLLMPLLGRSGRGGLSVLIRLTWENACAMLPRRRLASGSYSSGCGGKLVRGVPGKREWDLLPLGPKRLGRTKAEHVGTRDRRDSAIVSPDPGHDRAVVEADRDLGSNEDLAFDAFDHAGNGRRPTVYNHHMVLSHHRHELRFLIDVSMAMVSRWWRLRGRGR